MRHMPVLVVLRGLRRLTFIPALATVALLALAGLYCLTLQLSGNFHEVIAGELYRSAQMPAGAMGAYSQRYGIRTIINLRGRKSGRDWYEREVDEARALGIKHVDFEMSAAEELTAARSAELLSTLRDAEKPILLHCQAGADRSGLAAALYLAAISKSGEEAAEAQLSLRFGHVSLPFFSAAFAMDETFEMLEPSLGFPDS